MSRTCTVTARLVRATVELFEVFYTKFSASDISSQRSGRRASRSSRLAGHRRVRQGEGLTANSSVRGNSARDASPT
jgi:hypothetical protein